MSLVHRIADGFQNLVANLGTSRDKSYGNDYVQHTLGDDEIVAAYRTSDIARKIVDMPARDSCREWREWQAESDQIDKIEKEERRLGLQNAILEARTKARLFGGGAVYIGTSDNDTSLPLDPSRIRSGGIRYLTVLSRRHLASGDIQRDPRLPGFMLPEEYSMSAGTTGQVPIHPSRLVVFRGPKYPDPDLSVYPGWGDSVLNSTLNKVKHLDGSMANLASLVFEAKLDIIKIKDFSQNLRDGGEAYESLMLRRWGLAAKAKSIVNALLMDENEEYEQKTVNFSNLPDVVDRFMQAVSAGADIPMTLLFGISPGGLNATGESDTRGYYDRIRTEQTLEIEPAMSILDECLLRSALGDRPEEVHFNWRPLWQPTFKERAESGDKLMSALTKLDQTGSVPTEAIGRAAVNALTESGVFPGLEGYVEELGAEEPDTDDEADALGTQIGEEGVTDAAPRTLYVSRRVQNASDIVAWAKAQGIKDILPADELHVTIAYSRTPVDWMKIGEAWSDQIKVTEGGPRMMDRFGPNGEALVLLFSSAHLTWRHVDIRRESGASWDWGEYQPHITISTSPLSGDMLIEPYQGEIVLGPEIFAEVKE